MKYTLPSFIRQFLSFLKGFYFPIITGFITLLYGCSPMTTVRNDPLIGKIYLSQKQLEITYPDLLEKIIAADVVYLGENHDNESHHRHQLQILKDLVDQGKRPAIGFEFFSVDQTGYLMSFVSGRISKHPASVDSRREEQLRSDLGWQNRADSTWQFYFQFIQFAAEHGLTIFGADLPSGIVQRVTRSGTQQLTPVEKEFLKTTKLEDTSYRELMYQKFKASHCGFAHKKMMEKMYETWLARNDAMAHSIVTMKNTNPKEPIVMILGKGHVEHNMAVFERVHHRLPKLTQLNLGFTEIARKPTPLKDYFTITKIGDKTFLPEHEYLWFTQRTSYEDPCVKFHEQLKRMKAIHPKKKKGSAP